MVPKSLVELAPLVKVLLESVVLRGRLQLRAIIEYSVSNFPAKKVIKFNAFKYS